MFTIHADMRDARKRIDHLRSADVLESPSRMFLQRIVDWFGPPKRTIPDIVQSFFPAPVRDFAEAFYRSWDGEELLTVQLGDGHHELYDKNAFFTQAWFQFFGQPWEQNGFCILGTHAEDPLGMLVMNTKNGKVYYAFEQVDDDTLTELADSFPEFIVALEKSGWKRPAASRHE